MSASVLDLPYYPISQFYRERFGSKVYKISVAVADTCPNREGLKGMQTCNFCDQWGSAAYSRNLDRPLREQIESVREILRTRRGAEKFLVYFQAYTTTFGRVSRLSEQVEVALSYPDVVGVVIGTRPDCISQAFIDMVNAFTPRTFVAVEMGLQSFCNETLKWMRRGHTAEDSERALWRLHKDCPNLNLGVHLIFGNPGETDEMMIEAARRVNLLPVQNVKLHHMHVLKGTPLADEYASGDFVPVDRETYFRRVGLFLRALRPDMAVHRLSALASRWDELVAPEWSARKMETYQGILDYMRVQGLQQGQEIVT